MKKNKEVLAMPSSYSKLNTEEMEYIWGGLEYSKNFCYRAPVAYDTFMEAGKQAMRLANGFGHIWSNNGLIRISGGTKLTSVICRQWASVLYGAAMKIRQYRSNKSKRVVGNVKITGSNSYMTVNTKVI